MGNTIRNREEATRFILSCEEAFDKRFTACAEEIIRRETPVLTVSGPTCVGKTTVSDRLRKFLADRGKKTVFFSFDDYFLDRVHDNTVTDEPPDYDSPEVLDMEVLEKVITGLAKENTVDMPLYDFVTGKRSGFRRYTPQPDEIQIWEGIQAGYSQVEEMLGKNKLSLYLHVETAPPPEFSVQSISSTGYFTEEDRRLCRRMLRDVRCRSASPSFTLFLWETVRANELRLVLPQRNRADYVLNTGMDYEPYVLRQCLASVWETITEEDLKEKAVSLALKLAPYHNDAFTTQAIPTDSLFREFIGTT